jgi:hypothetical protein
MHFSVPLGGVPDTGAASWIRAEGEPLAHPVYVRLALGDDGEIVTTGLLVDGGNGALTTRGSRVPLAEVASAFAAVVAKPAVYKRLARELHDRERSDAEDEWEPNLSPAPWIEFVAVSHSGPDALRHKPVARSRPGRRGYTDDHWREFAKAYKRAKRSHPRAHIKALRAEYHVTEPTIHRWRRTAEEKGFLSPSTQGQATPGRKDK